MLVAIGKRKNGVSETDFDRLHFSEENLTRHLTETELARIDAHLHQGGEKLTDEEKAALDKSANDVKSMLKVVS